MRLTRPESQARTRAELIATARDLFLSDGFANTSLDRVAEAAGYSKGAVYSNFRNKTQLCLEVLELIHTTKLGEVSALLATPDSLDERLAEFQAWAEHTLGDVGWTMLEFELMVLSRHDPQLRDSLVASLGTARTTVVGVLRALLDAEHRTLPLPVEQAAASMISLAIGLGVQRTIDPSISAQTATDHLRILLASARDVGGQGQT